MFDLLIKIAGLRRRPVDWLNLTCRILVNLTFGEGVKGGSMRFPGECRGVNEFSRVRKSFHDELLGEAKIL